MRFFVFSLFCPCLILTNRAWVGNFKQRVPITSKSSKFKNETQAYVAKLPKSTGARYYCPKIPQVPGTPGTRVNSSTDQHGPPFTFLYVIYVHICMTLSSVSTFFSRKRLVCSIYETLKVERKDFFKLYDLFETHKPNAVTELIQTTKNIVQHESAKSFFPVLLPRIHTACI